MLFCSIDIVESAAVGIIGRDNDFLFVFYY